MAFGVFGWWWSNLGLTKHTYPNLLSSVFEVEWVLLLGLGVAFKVGQSWSLVSIVLVAVVAVVSEAAMVSFGSGRINQE